MADDAAGAVRRTPRPTGDRQTPETGPQESVGTTNTASPVSGDQPAVSSRVSSQDDSGRAWTLGDAAERLSVGFTQVPPAAATRPAFGDPEGPRRDPVGTVRSHDDGSRAVKVTDGLATHPWCSVTPRDGTVWLVHEDVAEWGTEREWRLEELRAKLAEEPEILFPGPECDMEAYAALPPCTACEGGGQDTHGTVFEAPLAVHFAGPDVEIGGRRRQLCMWCGHVLVDTQLDQFRAEGVLPPAWPVGTLVRIEDGLTTEVRQDPDAELPPGCCALPDHEDAGPWTPTVGDRVSGVETHLIGQHTVTGYFHSSGVDGLSWLKIHADDPETAQRYLVATSSLKPCPEDDEPEHCGKHTGNCSNRCLLPANHTGECDDDPVPDEAQETHAATDWPAEEADRA